MKTKSKEKESILPRMELEQSGQKEIGNYVNGSNSNDGNDNNAIEAEEENYFRINRFMIPAKITYFFNVSRREIDTYFVLFFISLGFNAAEAGYLSGLQYIGGILGATGWSYVADKFRIHKVLVVALGIMAIIITSILPILGIPVGDKNRFKCPYNHNETLQTENLYKTSRNHDILFYTILIVAVIGKSFDASVASFVDTGCLYRVKKSPRKTNYGGQRFIGSLGVGFGGMSYSISITYFPNIMMSCESGIFITYALIVIALSICCYWLFNGVELETEEVDGKDINIILRSTLKNMDNIFFLVCVLFGGVAQGLFFNFLFVRLKDLHAEPLIFGLQTCVVAVSGAMAYYFSIRIIKIVGGTMNAMAISCLAWSLRFFCVSLLRNPYFIFPIEIFHGFTYSLFLTSAFEHAAEISDPVILTTICGILNGLYIELGSLTSNIIGGKMYHTFGGQKMFIICSLGCLSWGLIMLGYELFKWIRRKNHISADINNRNN